MAKYFLTMHIPTALLKNVIKFIPSLTEKIPPNYPILHFIIV